MIALRLTLLIGLSFPATAAERLDLFNLSLGTPAAVLPADAFHAYACGSDGGPPGTPLGGFNEFDRCPPDAEGLHEVYFEYDDEAEYRARARNDFPAGWSGGTSYRSFPLIVSALFADDGTLKALRLVTDPRPEQRDDRFLRLRPRQEHHLLLLYLLKAWGLHSLSCRELPLESGETPVLGMSVKRSCRAMSVDGKYTYHIEARYLRRPGEGDVDPRTGLLTQGAYLSETRAEMRLASP